MTAIKKIKKKINSSIIFKRILASSIKLLEKSFKKIIINLPASYNPNQQYLFAFWHGQQLLPLILCEQHKSPCAALVSTSNDGNILEYVLKQHNITVIRGSSRNNNIYALKAMIKILKQGYSVGFGVDGPIGPIYKIKPGILYLAQKLSIPILPIGSSANRKFILTKAWDKFEIPKLFSSVQIEVGQPIYITDITEGEITLESELHRLAQLAAN